MAYLQRIYSQPTMDDLTMAEIKHLEKHLHLTPTEIGVDGQTVEYRMIDEVEVAQAARMSSAAGWLVRNLLYGGDRYHIGMYFGQYEVVLPNVSLRVAQYVVQTIAYYADRRIRYKGPENVTPLTM